VDNSRASTKSTITYSAQNRVWPPLLASNGKSSSRCSALKHIFKGWRPPSLQLLNIWACELWPMAAFPLATAVADYLADWTVAECTWSGGEICVSGGWHPCCEGRVWQQEAGLAGDRTFLLNSMDTGTGPCRCIGLHWDRVSGKRLQRGRREKHRVGGFKGKEKEIKRLSEVKGLLAHTPHLVTPIYASSCTRIW